jgi:hypothetical protein
MIGKRPARRAAVVTAATLVPLAVFGGVGFAKGSASSSEYQYGKVTICHSTHSATHPYVKITISTAGWLNGHKKHAGDIGPIASTASCPTTAPAPTVTTTTHGNSGNHGNGNNGHHGKP